MGRILKALMPAYGGYTIARDDKVIFLKGAIPGELVDVEVEEKKRNYSVARVINVIEPSEFRTIPQCKVFGICGGCQLQYISYEKQLIMKDEILVDSLNRLGSIEITPGTVLSDSQWNYRHKAQFKVSKQGEPGFFRQTTREVVTLANCPLMKQEINDIFQKIKQNGLAHNLSEIHISLGDTPVALLRGKDYDESMFDRFIEIGLSGIAYNDSIAYGGAYTGFDMNGLRYTVSPWTFFQSHWSLNRKLVDFMIEKLITLEGKRVLDLYAGAGNFSIPVSIHAAEVVAVEENAYAIEDGIRNLDLNNIGNCKFVKSSAEKYKINTKYDVIILDPPRPGITSEVIKKILENTAERIVYISCNPSTFARDLKKLKEKYDVISVNQVDFFPNTFHIEAVAVLQAR